MADNTVELNVENLGLSFGGLQALSDISFQVKKGQIVSIIGPNGAGKTSTLNCVSGFYRPQKGEVYFRDKNQKGYFSHIDPVNFSASSAWLGDLNKSKKNWNSIGDHTPAYMLNLMLSIEGIPEFKNEFNEYKAIQKELADLICDHFYDPDCKYVKERFHENWVYDPKYAWQQDRAVVGHNLKIAWNLTRLFHLLRDPR